MTEDPLDRIGIDPQVMLGKPVIRGTRITVEILLEKIAAGCSMPEILKDYPGLNRVDVLAAVAYAREALYEEANGADSAHPLASYVGTLPDEDAEEMLRVIEDEFERIDPDDWR
jgi:uncharacterized protein (DUF433 family)